MLDGVNRFNARTAAEFGDPETQRPHRPVRDGLPHADVGAATCSISPDEPQSTWDLYGPDAHKPGTFAYNCLLARRMAERGVRFTQIYHRGWDVHGDVVELLPKPCHDVDRACYAPARPT